MWLWVWGCLCLYLCACACFWQGIASITSTFYSVGGYYHFQPVQSEELDALSDFSVNFEVDPGL